MKKQEDGSELWDYTTNTGEGAESLEELEQEEWDALRLMEEKAQQGLSYMEEKIAGLDAREILVYAATGLTLFFLLRKRPILRNLAVSIITSYLTNYAGKSPYPRSA